MLYVIYQRRIYIII